MTDNYPELYPTTVYVLSTSNLKFIQLMYMYNFFTYKVYY